MEDCVHLRLADGVEVHQMAVVGQEVVVRATDAPFVAVVGEHVEIKLIAVEHGVDGERVIDIERVAGGFNVPPGGSAPDKQGHEDYAANCCEDRAAFAAWRRDLAGFETSITNGRSNDASHAHD